MGVSPVLWVEYSTLDREVVGSNLVSSNILDGNGVKAIPGSIPAPNLGSIIKKRWKNIGSRIGHSQITFFLSFARHFCLIQKIPSNGMIGSALVSFAFISAEKERRRWV